MRAVPMDINQILFGDLNRRQEDDSDGFEQNPMNFLMNLLQMRGASGDYVFGQQGLDDIVTRRKWFTSFTLTKTNFIHCHFRLVMEQTAK